MVTPYKCFQNQGHVKHTLTEHAFSRDNSTLEVFFIYQPTVALHNGQGHRKEHELCHAQKIYRHARFECQSVQYISIKIKVNKL